MAAHKARLRKAYPDRLCRGTGSRDKPGAGSRNLGSRNRDNLNPDKRDGARLTGNLTPDAAGRWLAAGPRLAWENGSHSLALPSASCRPAPGRIGRQPRRPSGEPEPKPPTHKESRPPSRSPRRPSVSPCVPWPTFLPPLASSSSQNARRTERSFSRIPEEIHLPEFQKAPPLPNSFICSTSQNSLDCLSSGSPPQFPSSLLLESASNWSSSCALLSMVCSSCTTAAWPGAACGCSQSVTFR